MSLGQWLGAWAGRWLGAVLGTRHRVTAQPVRAVVRVGRPTVSLRPMLSPELPPGGWFTAGPAWQPPRHRIVARAVCVAATVGRPRIGRDLYAEDEQLLLMD